MFFWILPIGVFGKSSTNLTERGRLKRASSCAQCSISAASSTLCAALQVHIGDRDFAELVVGNAEHGAFGYRRMLVERVLDFLRIDVLAAGNDHVLGAVDQRDEAVFVDGADVAGPAPAIAELEESPWSAPARCNIRA